MILQLSPSMDVLTPLGDGTALFLLDYGLDVNPVFLVRFKGGILKSFYSEQVRPYNNPMNEEGWDVEPFDNDKVKCIPPGAKRNTNFKKK